MHPGGKHPFTIVGNSSTSGWPGGGGCVLQFFFGGGC